MSSPQYLSLLGRFPVPGTTSLAFPFTLEREPEYRIALQNKWLRYPSLVPCEIYRRDIYDVLLVSHVLMCDLTHIYRT